MEEPLLRRRSLYGRRQGPKLRPGRKRLLEDRLPEIGLAVAPGDRLEPGSLFDAAPAEIWLEIGFGGGEHLAALALAHPEIGFIGVEPFRNGVARLLEAVAQHGLSNVRVLMDDARLLLDALPAASLGRCFILFPDPWPKTRHHKRRIVNPETAAQLARITRPGGGLLLATDDAGYAGWMIEVMLAEPGFSWRAERAAHWREAPGGWVTTRYEAKARAAGRRPIFLEFTRRPA